MKALTIWQPWASAISLGYKHFETRGWATKYRGPIAIHAAARLPKKSEILLLQEEYCLGESLITFGFENKEVTIRSYDDIIAGRPCTILPHSSIVALAELTDCIAIKDEFIDKLDGTELALGCYEEGRYAWKLENIVSLNPTIPCKGRQGLWNVDDKFLNMNMVR